MSFKKILVVEEDPDNLRRLREILKTQGHKIVTAPDCRTIVDKVSRELPDLVLMGIGTPESDNDEATKKLKAEPSTSSIPVITLRTLNDLNMGLSGKERGFENGLDQGEIQSRFVDLVEEALKVEGIGGGEFSTGRGVFPAAIDPPTDAGNILIVENGQRNWKEISSLLGPLGYAIHHASGWEEMLKAVDGNRTDLVLVDSSGNEGEGPEMVRRLRANGPTSAIPIVLLTSGSNRNQKHEGIEAGCDDFIDKPIDRIELTARVRSLIRLSRNRSGKNDRDRLDTVLGEMGEGILFLDGNWNLMESNEAARRLLELDSRGWRGRNLLDHIYSSRTVSVKRSYLANHGEQTIRFESRREETDFSNALSISIVARKFFSEDGTVREIILVAKDITVRQEEERMKDEFLSTVSHKLKTPLSVILANVEYMTSGYYGELSMDQANAAREIGTGGYQLLHLFDKLLAFISPSSLDSQDTTPRTVSSLLERFVANTRKRKENQSVLFELTVDKEIRNSTINFASFEIALESIVENAVKFNVDPAAKVVIHAARGEESSLVVSVADNGPGIPSEHADKIFRRFYQIEKFHTGNVAGVGLGLPLARRLIERHGGTVELDSSAEKGSTFRITVAEGVPLDTLS